MNDCPNTAALAYAEAARLQCMLVQHQRMEQSGCPDGANAAYYFIQTAVARLYEALDILPDHSLAAEQAHSALQDIAVSYRPDMAPPEPAYAERLRLIAAAIITGAMTARIRDKTAGSELRRALAEYAGKEAQDAERAGRHLPALPTTGWSKRQARAFDTQSQAAGQQALENAREASHAYRATLPCTIMPRLTASGFNAKSRDSMLNALNRHSDDNVHILVTRPDDNADGEIQLESAVALIFRERRYLKSIDEPYPDGYPAAKAGSSLRSAACELENEARRCQEPANREFCLAAAARARQAANLLAPQNETCISGRITEVANDIVTIVSVTQAQASPDIISLAQQLLECEAVVTLAADESGKPIATSIRATP